MDSDELVDPTPPPRFSGWLQARPIELVGVAVLLLVALVAAVALWWSATGRPSTTADAEVVASGVAAAGSPVDPGGLGDDDPSEASGAVGAGGAGQGAPGDGGSGAGDGAGGAGADAAGGSVGTGGATSGGGGAGGNDASGGAPAGAGGAKGAGGAAGSAPSGGEMTSVGSATPVTVHVTGAVARSGLVTVPAGSRVGDAVDLAGGLTADAAPERVNLARPVVDGEHVHVPRVGEDPAPPPAPPPSGPGPAEPGATAGGSGPPPDPAGGGATGGEPLVDLNHAGLDELQTLPGIGPARAAAIVAHREERGPFAVPGDLREVSGIGEKTFQALVDRVTVG
jgi:competence protein ComEA